MKTKWLEAMMARAEDLPEKHRDGKNLAPVERGDTVVGEVPADLRLLLGLSNMLHEEARSVGLGHTADHLRALSQGKKPEHECKDILHKALIIEEAADALKALFFVSLRHEMSIGANGIAIKEGWKVVTFDEEKRDSLSEMLAEISQPGGVRIVGVGIGR